MMTLDEILVEEAWHPQDVPIGITAPQDRLAIRNLVPESYRLETISCFPTFIQIARSSGNDYV